MVETFQNFDTRNPNSLNHLNIQEIDNNLQAQRNDQHAETVAALFPIPAIVPLRVKNASMWENRTLPKSADRPQNEETFAMLLTLL